MPYKDKKKQRKYQLKFGKQRRLDWIYAHGPCEVCASFTKLEVAWRTAKPILKTANIWTRSDIVREKILENCYVLCHRCNKAKKMGEKACRLHGTDAAYGRGCRCDACKKAHNNDRNEWRYRHGHRKPRKTIANVLPVEE